MIHLGHSLHPFHYLPRHGEGCPSAVVDPPSRLETEKPVTRSGGHVWSQGNGTTCASLWAILDVLFLVRLHIGTKRDPEVSVIVMFFKDIVEEKGLEQDLLVSETGAGMGFIIVS